MQTQTNTTTPTRQNTRQTRPGAPNQLFNRDQFPMHVGQVPDVALGERINFTLLKYRPRYCNNFQVWGYCAVHDLYPSSCNYFKRCSNCDQQDHGRRKCRHLPANENPNA